MLGFPSVWNHFIESHTEIKIPTPSRPTAEFPSPSKRHLSTPIFILLVFQRLASYLRGKKRARFRLDEVLWVLWMMKMGFVDWVSQSVISESLLVWIYKYIGTVCTIYICAASWRSELKVRLQKRNIQKCLLCNWEAQADVECKGMYNHLLSKSQKKFKISVNVNRNQPAERLVSDGI